VNHLPNRGPGATQVRTCRALLLPASLRLDAAPLPIADVFGGSELLRHKDLVNPIEVHRPKFGSGRVVSASRPTRGRAGSRRRSCAHEHLLVLVDVARAGGLRMASTA
jgi:hypothetical protein